MSSFDGKEREESWYVGEYECRSAACEWGHFPSEGTECAQDYTMCVPCGRAFTLKKFCPICLVAYRSEATNMVQCQSCQFWIHTARLILFRPTQGERRGGRGDVGEDREDVKPWAREKHMMRQEGRSELGWCADMRWDH